MGQACARASLAATRSGRASVDEKQGRIARVLRPIDRGVVRAFFTVFVCTQWWRLRFNRVWPHLSVSWVRGSLVVLGHVSTSARSAG